MLKRSEEFFLFCCPPPWAGSFVANDAICEGIDGLNSPFDHLQKVNQQLTQTKPCNTLPPCLKRRDSRSVGYTGGPVNIQAVSFPGVNSGERVFQVRHGESLKKFIIVDGGVRTHDPKKTWSVDDAIC